MRQLERGGAQVLGLARQDRQPWPGVLRSFRRFRPKVSLVVPGPPCRGLRVEFREELVDSSACQHLLAGLRVAATMGVQVRQVWACGRDDYAICPDLT